ncbi:MAG: TlpA disulfide reductase family protein [Lachnospiraceae bacterium]|nr:TlpA family protein disulfide reductase [Robinsoniella sp.]MDY3765090.1 TlpA disulfide reductase family protein [Lachnospiraceae bacterium]
MKQKKSFFLTLALLIILLGAAVVAYNKLASDHSGGNLSSLPISDSATESESHSEESDASPANASPADASPADASPADASPADASDSEQTEDRNYMLAPDFSVTDAAGNEITLYQLLVKPAVLNFWNSNCPPCKSEMPDFEEMYRQLGDNVTFIMIDTVGAMGETKESGQNYIEEQGFTFPVYFDTKQDAIYSYGITAFPTTYFIDEEGYLIAGARGMLDMETLQMGIDMILPK